MAISVQTLDSKHQLDKFDCGRPELNDWLAKIARRHQKKRISSTFVIVDDQTPEIILGFYALTVCIVGGDDIPRELSKKLPRNIPGIKLARLATDLAYQGHKELRVGESLLIDAMTRAKNISDNVGGYALFVDAIDEKAACFYERYGFTRFPDQLLVLFLPIDG